MKCTICLGSETLRAIKFKSVLEPELDLSVFIKPSATTDPVDVPVPSTEETKEAEENGEGSFEIEEMTQRPGERCREIECSDSVRIQTYLSHEARTARVNYP